MTQNPVPFPSADHLQAMGYLVNRFAFGEWVLGLAIQHLMKLGMGGQMVTAIMGYVPKRDLARILADIAKHDAYKAALNEGIDLIDGAKKLRDLVVHGLWKPGRKTGRIKPIVISVKGSLKLLGRNHNEQEYSADDFRNAGAPAHEGASKLLLFLQSVGMDKKTMTEGAPGES